MGKILVLASLAVIVPVLLQSAETESVAGESSSREGVRVIQAMVTESEVSGLCGPGGGNCCAANPTPGCDDAACCDLVCLQEPFCCQNQWDQICANLALVLCDCQKRCLYEVVVLTATAPGGCDACPHGVGDICAGSLCPGQTCEGYPPTRRCGPDCCMIIDLVDCAPATGECGEPDQGTCEGTIPTVFPQIETQCPSTATKCPPTVTECVEVATSCPETETKCPADPTTCIAASTICPLASTFCPAKVTQCPQTPTVCPISLPACDPYPHKMHYPQFPDGDGWDIKASDPRILADDWQCSQTGTIDSITFWGSWHSDLEGMITTIQVRISDDIPDPDGSGPQFSMPGAVLWQQDFNKGQFDYQLQAQGIQGWYDPGQGSAGAMAGDHLNYYRIQIANIPKPCDQQKGNIYWLAIQVQVADPKTEFGWKTAQQHFNDDAVWGDRSNPVWDELRDPITGTSLDMAFIVDGNPASPCPCAPSNLAQGCCGDLNGDSTVNASDLALLLGAWGSGCSLVEGCCMDLSGDGVVNASDLALLLGNWGVCR